MLLLFHLPSPVFSAPYPLNFLGASPNFGCFVFKAGHGARGWGLGVFVALRSTWEKIWDAHGVVGAGIGRQGDVLRAFGGFFCFLPGGFVINTRDVCAATHPLVTSWE